MLLGVIDAVGLSLAAVVGGYVGAGVRAGGWGWDWWVVVFNTGGGGG